MNIKPMDMAILEAYQRYGQKLLIVLSTAVRIAKMNRIKSMGVPGDFEYKALVEELEKQNFRYNPSMLLRTLEREYNIVETTYRSSNQHWYRFKDLENVERVLNALKGATDEASEPEVMMLKIQMKSLQVNYWIKKLKHMCIKGNITPTDIKIFKRFAFDVLPKLLRVLRKAEEYEDQLYAEINLLKELLNLASIVADRIDRGNELSITDDGIRFEEIPRSAIS